VGAGAGLPGAGFIYDMVSGGVALFGGSVYNNVFDRHGTNYEKGLMLGYAGNSSIPSGLLTLSGEKPNSPMNVLLGVGQGYAIEEAERINGVGAMVSEIATPAIDTAVMEVATSPILIKGTGILIKGTAAASRVGRLGLHAPVRTVWANGVTGLADDLAKHAGNVTSKKGFTDVFIHSTSDSFHVLHNGSWVKLSHRDVANFLKSKGVSGDLRLISCDAGQGQLAQNLANKLNVTVEAATTKVGVPIDFKSAPLLEPGGIWIPFKPRGK
jgi:hypothetical protein